MRKIDRGSTARKSPIGWGGQDVGHSGVATGRGVLNLSSSSSVGDEENPHGWSFTLYGYKHIIRKHILKVS
ncbi:hypothetical protein [Rummeliibacillus suwonensis]|uniref:hypothetical protein n=1 Tax=Rummeliibacillus suwonensis TaxID=1306154 RepID=UPI001AAF9D80|nr:hypothetical protein [Rummeliibacillus suwonensis]MBO2534365.1 hypothetical protein [Rummeliibacillus suwonensis]